MAIRISRNDAGNCINFIGSTSPAYWNACLSAQINTDDSARVDIINDIRSANEPEVAYEFYAVAFADFADKDGNPFATAQEMVDYVNANANVTGASEVGRDLSGDSIDFRLDDTSTTIIVNNGSAFGVNSIKAVANTDGTIHIHAIGDGLPTGTEAAHDYKHFEKIDPLLVSIAGVTVPGGLNDVVNALNELFTVGAFESVVISDPYSTMVADVAGVTSAYTLEGTNAVDPAGGDIFGSLASGNYAGLLSSTAISEPGEYFTFDIRNESQIGFGLVHTQDSYDAGYFTGSSLYADPASFAVSNSAHYGFQFSHWFHPTPNGPWTNYGASTGYVQGPGWTNTLLRFMSSAEVTEWLAGNPVKMKVGIDANGFIEIAYYDVSESAWVMCARTSYPVVQGASYRLGIKVADSVGRVVTAPKIHEIATTVTPPTTLGDQSITVFEDNAGDINGTLAGGISADPSVTGSNDGFVSTESISAIGEYFQFEWSAGDANVGLFSEQDHAVADLQADRTDWNNNQFIYFGARTENNGELNAIYYENGSHTTFASTGGNGYGRVGFDEQGRATLWYSSDGTTWVKYKRHNQSAPTGTYKFIWVAQALDSANLNSLTKGTMTFAPTMNFRYIESPDGYYSFPLFATQEEADYYELTVSGSDNGSHTHIYPDDPTFSTWYMPATSNQMNYGLTPVEDGVTTFDSNPIIWTEITSLTNADLAPPAFTATTLTVDENSAVNYQTQPADTGYTTTFSGLESVIDGITDNGFGTLVGTAPEVTGDNVTNPSDTYTIGVHRTNSYGTTSGTLTLEVTNLTAPATAISGFSHDNTSPALVDADTMADGSAVHVHNTLNVDKRFVIEQAYVETNILPALQAAGDKYYIGIPVASHSFATVEDSDWDAAIVWEYETATTHSFKFIDNGTIVQNIIINSLTDSFYDYAIESQSTSEAWLIACNVNQINTEPSPADGGSFSHTREVLAMDSTEPHTIHMAVVSTTGDFSTTGISEIDVPAVASNQTSWSKALDFSGSNERAQQVDSSYYRVPMKMAGINNNVVGNATPGYTSDAADSRPWATAIVFKTTTYNDNQHVWNLGEGAGTVDDNIYLRRSTDRKLYFGWGRSGEVNECLIHPSDSNELWSLTPGNWYGIYIAHTGERLGSGHTAADIADCFDIRLMGSSQNWATAGYSDTNLSDAAAWTAGSFGARMNREFTGDMTIGGRGANRSFRGQIASYVQTTLRQNQPMPTQAEIELMITDPVQWLQNHKVGNPFRLPWQAGDSGWNFAINDGSSGYSTAVWLMGDGANDSYANMIRNQVHPSDQNYTKLNLISMVSNDIVNVSIPGLS